MKKEKMMDILENPTEYNVNERLSAARLAITLLDLISIGEESPLKTKPFTKEEPERCQQVCLRCVRGRYP